MCKEIPLQDGSVALVSDCDYERVRQYNWSRDSNGYVCRMESYYVDGKRKRRKIMLHRFILNSPPHLQVDHKFGKRLDNRRSEIRPCTRSQNAANSAPRKGRYKGICWMKADRKWRALIKVNGIKYHLGMFATAEEAALAYDCAALAAWGEFAYLNFKEHKELYLLGHTATRVPKRITAPTN